jgi:hypothetical protein
MISRAARARETSGVPTHRGGGEGLAVEKTHAVQRLEFFEDGSGTPAIEEGSPAMGFVTDGDSQGSSIPQRWRKSFSCIPIFTAATYPNLRARCTPPVGTGRWGGL